MKRVSCKVFFTVLWRGICQALGWFFGLFGYKRDGKFAKCVWGLFATSVAVIMCVFAIVVVCAAYHAFSEEYGSKQSVWESSMYVSNAIAYIEPCNGEDGYLINKNTGEKLLTGICWIAEPVGKEDSLVCFSDGKRRGYFNKRTGKVAIKPQYRHAWVFSDGIASVEIDGKIKFIDGTGKVVIDNGLEYDPRLKGYVFDGNYCIIYSEDGEKCGLMDRTGKMVLPMEYSEIADYDQHKYWSVRKDGKSAVYDENLNLVLPYIDGEVLLFDKTIDVVMADHTLRKYDYEGNLINDFYVSDVQLLEYETDEIYYAQDCYSTEDGQEQCTTVEQHKMATARLRAYTAGDAYKGLMTADGRIVTMPLYEVIRAIGDDTYLCTVSSEDKIIVDGKGNVIGRP